MLAMRRESDNLNNSSSNTPHSNFTASNLTSDNNLTHLNYPHPVHSYSSSASYSGYQSSKINARSLCSHQRRIKNINLSHRWSVCFSVYANNFKSFVSQWKINIFIGAVNKKEMFHKGNRANPALISPSSSQNQLEEYVDILQVQQLLLENSTASTSSSSTVNTVSYSSPASTSALTASPSKNLQARPKVNLQKATEFSQLQGKLIIWSSMLLVNKSWYQPVSQIFFDTHLLGLSKAPPFICSSVGIIFY